MNKKVDKMYAFLKDIEGANPTCYEAVTKGLDKIAKILEEATEDAVANLKKKVPDKFEEPAPEEDVELVDEGEIPETVVEAMDMSAAPQVGYYTLTQDETFTIEGDSPEKDYDISVKTGKYPLHRDSVDKQLFVTFPATVVKTGKPTNYMYRVDDTDVDAEIVDDI